MNWFVLFAFFMMLFAFAVIFIAVIVAKKQVQQDEFQMTHKGCGGDIEFVMDTGENGFEGLVLKAVCRKCGAEQVLLKYGFETITKRREGDE